MASCGVLHGFRGAVTARAGHHVARAVEGFLDLGEEARLLLRRQGGRLAGGARDDDAVAAGRNKGEGELAGLRVVHAAFGVEWGHHGGQESADLRGHTRYLPLPLEPASLRASSSSAI